jgi:hypothetical protein
MKQNNGNRNDHATLIMEDQTSAQVSAPTVQADLEVKTELATRTKLRARQKIQQNRFVIVAAGAVVFALLIFAVVSLRGCPSRAMEARRKHHAMLRMGIKTRNPRRWHLWVTKAFSPSPIQDVQCPKKVTTGI